MLSKPAVILGNNARREEAKRIYRMPCCRDKCLHLIGKHRAYEVIESCINEVAGLGRDRKHQYLLQKLRNADANINELTGFLHVSYNVGCGIEDGVNNKYYNVCHTCFQNCYGIGRDMLTELRTEVKLGFDDCAAGNRMAMDGSGRVSEKNNPHFVHALVEFAKQRGIHLNHYQMASLAVPNNPSSLTLFAWLDDHFNMVGQVAPNGNDIELEPTPTDEIYDEYLFDLDVAGMREDCLSKATFETMWAECFPHVKRHEYLAVGGKCHTCAALGIARKTHKQRADREQLKMLHSLHRSGYMNERRIYYGRRWKATQEPTKFLSIITDGMAQVHCQLPYYANLEQGDTLPQHLQGVLAHGRFLNIYRTFHNTYTAANMQIHTLLLALEDAYRHPYGLPDTVFLQIDGGSENVSKSVIAMCELLVARGIVKRIFLSRLMVGHTHEDIDGRFAKIWMRIRNAFVLTPSQYKYNVEQALTREDLPCKVEDIFAVPDYDAFIRPSIDTKFSRYSKRHGEKDWSVLGFKFEQVDADDNFPLGCKVSWRPFGADRHIRLVKDPQSSCGMTTDELGPISWLPEADERKGIPSGMFLLNSFPNANRISPEEFIDNSRADLEEVVKNFCEQYNSDTGVAYAQEWIDFRDNIAPQSDSVHDWLVDHPLHIPFHDTLVRGAPVFVPVKDVPHEYDKCVAPTLRRDRSRKSRVLDYVQWSRRGKTKSATDPSNIVPNIVCEGPVGVEHFSVPVHCKSSKVSVAQSLINHGARLPPIKRTESAPTSSVVENTSMEVEVDDQLSDNSDASEETDSENDCVNEWVTCRGKHYIPRHYCARDCVGNKFTVPKKYIEKASFGKKCPHGTIHSIVRKVGAEPNDIFFKVYNHVQYPDGPPPEESDDFCFVKCTHFMSSSLLKRMMIWDKQNEDKAAPKKVTREKRSHWQIEEAKPAQFDVPLEVDVHAKRKLRSGRVVADSIHSSPIATSSDTVQDVLREDADVNSDKGEPVGDSRHSTGSSKQPLRERLHRLPVNREHLSRKIHHSLVKKGLREEEPKIELSDFSSSNSDGSDSDSGD